LAVPGPQCGCGKRIRNFPRVCSPKCSGFSRRMAFMPQNLSGSENFMVLDKRTIPYRRALYRLHNLLSESEWTLNRKLALSLIEVVLSYGPQVRPGQGNRPRTGRNNQQ